MDEKIIFSLIVASAIAWFVANALIIIIKINLFKAKALVKEPTSVNFKANLWIAGILAYIIAYYFIAF